MSEPLPPHIFKGAHVWSSSLKELVFVVSEGAHMRAAGHEYAAVYISRSLDPANEIQSHSVNNLHPASACTKRALVS